MATLALVCGCASAWASNDAAPASALLGDYTRLAPALKNNALD
ncbi:MAG: hypothetical protein WA134_08140 [Rhodoferax sp.]